MQEPELLRVDAERIKRQMQEVAVGNYRAFISAADALHSIKEEISSTHKHLDTLVILHNFVYSFEILLILFDLFKSFYFKLPQGKCVFSW